MLKRIRSLNRVLTVRSTITTNFSITLFALSLLTAAASAGHASPSSLRWHCVAYGYGGAKNVWRTVNGEPDKDIVEAIKNAAAKCYREGLHVCDKSGCTWH